MCACINSAASDYVDIIILLPIYTILCINVTEILHCGGSQVCDGYSWHPYFDIVYYIYALFIYDISVQILV